MCAPELTCVNGQCVQPTTCNALKFKCNNPRPDDKTCPVLYYIVAP